MTVAQRRHTLSGRWDGVAILIADDGGRSGKRLVFDFTPSQTFLPSPRVMYDNETQTLAPLG